MYIKRAKGTTNFTVPSTRHTILILWTESFVFEPLLTSEELLGSNWQRLLNLIASLKKTIKSQTSVDLK
jgi:hypothetical protein